MNVLPMCVCVLNANPVLGGCLYFALARIYVATLSYIRIMEQRLHAKSCGWGGQDSTKTPGVFSFWCQVVRHHHSKGVEGEKVEGRDRGRAIHGLGSEVDLKR